MDMSSSVVLWVIAAFFYFILRTLELDWNLISLGEEYKLATSKLFTQEHFWTSNNQV